MAAAIATWTATMVDHSKTLVPGEIGTIAVISASRDQSNTVLSYIKGFLLSSPLLADQIEGINRDEIVLKGNVRIAVTTNSYRTSRGRTVLLCVGDDGFSIGKMTMSEPDVETPEPGVAIVDRIRWHVDCDRALAIAGKGLLFEKNRDYFGQNNDDVLAISGSTETFNPTLDPALINKARDEDPEASEAEWGGGWRRDIAAFLSEADIEAAIDYERPMELPPRSGLNYRSFADPSGGRHDRFCICVGHFEGTRDTGRFVLDVLRGAVPPFDPQEVTKQYAALLREYKLHEVTGDNYSAGWVETAFKDAGIKYVRAEKPKSALYLEAATLFARGGISLPNHPVLLRELRLLERRTHRSGRDTVDHGTNGHDDHANAVLGCAAWTMRRGYDRSMSWVG